jgi:hypothetical protein
MLRYADLRLDASTLKEYPDGSIRVTGQITQPGLRTYHRDGRKITEYQAPEELFRKETLDTLAGSTITVMHPRSGMVTADTWKDVAVGNVGDNVREDAGHAVADLYIREAAAVKAVKAGHIKHLSWGYKTDLDATPGTTPDGQRFDGVQRNLRGNHVALLPIGVAPRGGDECTLRLDSNGDEELPGLKSGVDEQSLKDKITALETELAKVRTDAAALPQVRAELTAATARIAELGEALKPERFDAAVEARVIVVNAAKAESIVTTGKSTLDLKRAIVAKRTPDLSTRVDSMGEPALDAVMVVYGSQPHPSMGAVLGVVAPVVTEVRTDAAAPVAMPKYADLYAKHLKDSQGAWKNSGEKVVRS